MTISGIEDKIHCVLKDCLIIIRMSLKSLLGIKEKRNEGALINPHPKLPSNRDILEDIENIKKNDPILSLAAILRKSSSKITLKRC
jgi:hypothetical protein